MIKGRWEKQITAAHTRQRIRSGLASSPWTHISSDGVRSSQNNKWCLHVSAQLNLLRKEIVLRYLIFLIFKWISRYESQTGDNHTQRKEAILDESDQLWVEFRHQHIATVSQYKNFKFYFFWLWLQYTCIVSL